MKTIKRSDIQIPRAITTDHGREAYTERICILSEGEPITELMKTIALTEALNVDRIVKGELL